MNLKAALARFGIHKSHISTFAGEACAFSQPAAGLFNSYSIPGQNCGIIFGAVNPFFAGFEGLTDGVLNVSCCLVTYL